LGSNEFELDRIYKISRMTQKISLQAPA